MSDGISTGLANGATLRGHERADDEKTTRGQAERWATLLGAQLSPLQPKTLSSEPTSAWHSSAGDMTPSNGTSGVAPFRNFCGNGQAGMSVGTDRAPSISRVRSSPATAVRRGRLRGL